MSRFALPLVALLPALLSAPGVGQSRPDLSGRWVLKTDPPAGPDSAETVADTAGAVADSGGIGADSSAGPRPPSDLRPVLRRRGRPDDQRQLSRLVAMAHPVPAFRISQTDTAVTFENADGFSYVVRPGADWDSIPVGDEYVRLRGRWRAQALEVEFRPPGGGRIVETYLLADSQSFLRLEVVVEHDILAQRLWRPRMYRRDPE